MLSRALRQPARLGRRFWRVDQPGYTRRLLDARVPCRHGAVLAHGIRVPLRPLAEPLDLVVAGYRPWPQGGMACLALATQPPRRLGARVAMVLTEDGWRYRGGRFE